MGSRRLSGGNLRKSPSASILCNVFIISNNPGIVKAKKEKTLRTKEGKREKIIPKIILQKAYKDGKIIGAKFLYWR
jgi:hypothetical protein